MASAGEGESLAADFSVGHNEIYVGLYNATRKNATSGDTVVATRSRPSRRWITTAVRPTCRGCVCKKSERNGYKNGYSGEKEGQPVRAGRQCTRVSLLDSGTRHAGDYCLAKALDTVNAKSTARGE